MVGIVKRKPTPAEYIEPGSMLHTHVHPETDSYISAVTRPTGRRSASITDLYVPEEHRQKGIGKMLLNSMMQQFPSLQGQVSSKIAAKNAYAAGRRMAGNESASLDDVYKKIDEDSSVNMWTPKAEGGEVGEPGITAYHGSPHDFERFDMSKIGTGEGAQAFGHGLYFAQNENVAKGYRDALAGKVDAPQLRVGDKTYPVKGGGWADRKEELLHRLFKEAKSHRIDNQGQPLGQYSDEAIESELRSMRASDELRRWAESELKGAGPIDVANPGHMYEVHIKAHPDHFLDWDKALWEQPEAIRRLAGWSPEHEKKYYDWQKNDTDSLLAALEGNGDHTPTRQPVRPQGSLPMSTKGSDIYEHIKNKFGAVDWPIDADAQTRATYRNGAAHRASQHLLEHGIKGIRYLDAGSRGASDKPTSNYVVFDDKLVNVKRKYAKGGTVQRSPKPVSDGSIVTRALMLTSKKA